MLNEALHDIAQTSQIWIAPVLEGEEIFYAAQKFVKDAMVHTGKHGLSDVFQSYLLIYFQDRFVELKFSSSIGSKLQDCFAMKHRPDSRNSLSL